MIDVNSGSFIGRGKGAGLEDTITKTNLEAAEEVVNQLRLRDIGGHHRDRLHRHGARAQPRRGHEDAAQDARRGPHEDLHRRDLEARPGRDDPPERDRGRARDHEPPLPDLRRRGRDPLRGDDRDRIRAPAARRRGRAPRRRGLPGADQPARHARSSPATARACCTRSRRRRASSFHFEGSEGLALDHFAITFQGTREEVEERALPFREGDEVLVEIVEPHMYDVDDAVAKIDGYIISIAGARRHVGEKRMVRIDQVGRTAATRAAARRRPARSCRPARRATRRLTRPRGAERARARRRATACRARRGGKRRAEASVRGGADERLPSRRAGDRRGPTASVASRRCAGRRSAAGGRRAARR